MSEFDNVFDWNKMTGDNDPFAKSDYDSDKRFYNLPKDKEGNGSALIRFLPDGEKREDGSMGTIQKVFRINTTFTKNGKKRFCNEWSPTTIGKPDPFFEAWQKLYNSGQKEESKKFNRATRYITNIKVINDPVNPENNGKIFLLDMSYKMAQAIQGYLQPPESQQKLGIKPKNLFNPINGYNFMLISKKGSNGLIDYDSSKCDDQPSAIYNSVEEAISDITTHCHKLSWFLDEANYKTYDFLQNRLKYVMFQDAETPSATSSAPKAQSAQQTQVKVSQPDEVPFDTGLTAPAPQVQQIQTPVAPTPTATQAQPATSVDDELDALINGLSK